MKTIFDPGYRRLIGRLKTARNACGLTQAQAAGKLGMCRNWLSKIERFELRLDVLHFMKLVNVYGLKPHDVIDELRDAAEAEGE